MKKSLKIALFSLALGIIVDILFFEALGIGLNVLLFEAVFIGAAYALSQLTEHPFSRASMIAGAFSILLALPFVLTTSVIGLVTAGFALFFANTLFVAFILKEDTNFRHPYEVFWSSFIMTSTKAFFGLTLFGDLSLPERLPTRTKSILLGVLILLPLLAVFLALFASADPLFNSYVTNTVRSVSDFFHIDGPIQALEHILIIGFCFMGFIMVFAAAYWKESFHASRLSFTHFGRTESAVVLTGTAVIFALFLITQGWAMFGGAAALQSLDITYAEYAHSGFYQLIAVAVLVGGLILSLRYLHGEHVRRALLGLHELLIVETMLVLVSAFIRVNLYIDVYGFTPSRLFAMATIITLALLFSLLLANVLQKESQAKYINRALVALGVCALVFSLMKPDAFAAQMNLNRALGPLKNDIDVGLFADLSKEAVPAIERSLRAISTMDASMELTDIGTFCNDSRLFPLYEDDVVRSPRPTKEDELEGFSVTNDQISREGEGPNDKESVPGWREWNLSVQEAKGVESSYRREINRMRSDLGCMNY